MKKLSQLTLAFILLFTSFSLSLAQTEEDFEVPEDVEIVEFEDGRTSAPAQEESTEEEEELNQETTEEETIREEIIVPQRTFWEVLGAILIPSFFIILVYFILKLFKF